MEHKLKCSKLSDGCPNIFSNWMLGIAQLLIQCFNSLQLVVPLPTIHFLSMLQVKRLHISLVCFPVYRLSGPGPSKGFKPIPPSLSWSVQCVIHPSPVQADSWKKCKFSKSEPASVILLDVCLVSCDCVSGLLAMHGVGLCVCKCNIEKSSGGCYSSQLLV